MFFAVSRVHFTEVLPNVFTIVNNYALYLLFLKFQSHIRWNVHSDQFEYFAHWSTVSTDRSRKFIWEQSKHYLFYCIKIHVSFYWNCIRNVHRFFLPYTLDFDFLLKQLLALKCLEIQNWKGDWPRSLSITLNGFCFCLLYHVYMNIQWSIRRREPARELFIYSCMVAVVNDRYCGFIIIASIYLFVSYRIKTHPFLDMHIKIVWQLTNMLQSYK